MTRTMVLVAGLAVVGLVGCGGGGTSVKTVNVSGTITLDGKPLEEAEVHFVGEQHAGFGKTDKTGKYRLVSGAQPGQNKVYFHKISDDKFAGGASDGLDAGQAAAAAAAQGGGVQKPKGQVIPDDFSSAKSKLTFNVPDGGSDSANFNLDTPK